MADPFEDTSNPHTLSDADFQRRLINFNTGKSDLLTGHRGWLDDLLKNTPATREFRCHVYGYASKKGDVQKNERLSYDRAGSVVKYLEDRDPKYTTRIETFRAFGENDPKYVAGESDDDGRWRAVEIHMKLDRPPRVKPGTLPIPRPKTTHMRWSVCASFGLNASILQAAQFGVGFFKFRDDETNMVRTYFAPMFGLGGGVNVLQMLKFLKGLDDKKIPGWAQIQHVVDKVLNNPSLLMNPYGALKEIGGALLTGASGSDYTDFTKCDVYLPVSHNKLNLKTIANVSGTGGLFQAQKIFVYGRVNFVEKSGKTMSGTKDLLGASSSGVSIQIPSLSAGAVGGPLIMI